MTSREAYLFGYIYGLIERHLPPSEEDTTGFRCSTATAHPLAGAADIINRGHRAKIITPILDSKIAELTAEISVETATATNTREPIPLTLQFSWQKGYYDSKSDVCTDTSEAAEIIRIRRHLGLSQTEFAEVIGSTQSHVSRWEKGRTPPSKASMSKIRALLE